MVDLSNEERIANAAHADWSEYNTRGLQHAANGEWTEAADAFAACVQAATHDANDDDQIGERDEIDAQHVLALVLGNLAQASFRAGRRDEGIAYAERACALRAELAGDDAITVARARADLAVMLGSMGRFDDGRALLARAIAGVEQVAGDEDARLTSMLENAARLSLSAGQPSNAEPLLLRLHALLDVNGLSTAVADTLLARVASLRSGRHAIVPIDHDTPDGENDDDVMTAPAVMPLVLDLVENTDLVDVALVDADPVDDDILGGVSFDLVDPEPAAAMETPSEPVESAPPYDVLGFAVEYGTPAEPEVPDLGNMIIAAPPSKRIATPASPSHATTAGFEASSTRIARPTPTLASIGSGTVTARPEPSAPNGFAQQEPTSRVERVGKLRAGRAAAPRSTGGLASASAATAAAAAFLGKLIWSGN